MILIALEMELAMDDLSSERLFTRVITKVSCKLDFRWVLYKFSLSTRFCIDFAGRFRSLSSPFPTKMRRHRDLCTAVLGFVSYVGWPSVDRLL